MWPDELNPNLVFGAITVVGSLVSWLVAKARGESSRGLQELLDERLTAALDDILDDTDDIVVIENSLVMVANRTALALGLDPKGKQSTIRVAVQWALTEASKRITIRRRNQEAQAALAKQVRTIAIKADEVVAAFEPKPEAERTVPTPGYTVEVVPP